MLERGKMDRNVIEMVGIDSLVPEAHLLRKIDKVRNKSKSRRRRHRYECLRLLCWIFLKIVLHQENL